MVRNRVRLACERGELSIIAAKSLDLIAMLFFRVKVFQQEVRIQHSMSWILLMSP
jgi:hypothetical protein